MEAPLPAAEARPGTFRRGELTRRAGGWCHKGIWGGFTCRFVRSSEARNEVLGLGLGREDSEVDISEAGTSMEEDLRNAQIGAARSLQASSGGVRGTSAQNGLQGKPKAP